MAITRCEVEFLPAGIRVSTFIKGKTADCKSAVFLNFSYRKRGALASQESAHLLRADAHDASSEQVKR